MFAEYTLRSIYAHKFHHKTSPIGRTAAVENGASAVYELTERIIPTECFC